MRTIQVVQQTLSALLALVLVVAWLPACGPTTYDYEKGEWEVVADGLPGALFAVYARTPNDVWAVGANPGDGKGGMVVHFDGTDWRRISGFSLRDIWWLAPGSDPDVLWMSGAKGLILKCSISEEKCEDQSVGGTETLFGIYAVNDSDVWAVGGDIQGTGKWQIIWHYDGTQWSQVTDFPEMPDKSSFFKVWARDANDVRVIGTMGAAIRFDGTTWSKVTVDTEDNLVTIHGNASRTLIVGGFGSGLLLTEDGAGYKSVDIGDQPQVNGVFVPPEYPAVIAGARGLIMREKNGGWEAFEDAPDTFFDYHAVSVDSEGGIWAVGGNILLPPLIDGLLVRFKPAAE